MVKTLVGYCALRASSETRAQRTLGRPQGSPRESPERPQGVSGRPWGPQGRPWERIGGDLQKYSWGVLGTSREARRNFIESGLKMEGPETDVFIAHGS